MKYKIGDRVKIKSNDFFNKNKDKLSFYVDSMALCFSNEIVTIKSHGRYPNTYRILEDEGDFLWTDEMIEGLVEEETLIERVDDNGLRFNEWLSYKGAFHIPDGYELKDENGNVINATKIVLEKKKKEYPKTYEECCKVLGFNEFLYAHTPVNDWYKWRLFRTLNTLIICRDAYWKIAGEEMGLGKPWKPSDSDYITGRYCIFVHRGNIICSTPAQDCVLTFPTPEMRDAFKENFDPGLEFCKELL